MNKELELLFNNFKVNGVSIPVALLFYDGHGEPYVTYRQYDKDNSYSSDDEISGYVTYYDFDVYSKGNFLAIVEAIKSTLKKNKEILKKLILSKLFFKFIFKFIKCTCKTTSREPFTAYKITVTS